MFNGFNWSGDEIEKKLKLASYWHVLESLPPNVVIAACAAAARGELGDDCRFAPTAAQLYQRAVSYLPKSPVKLLAEPESQISPEERARVADGLRELAKELARANAALPPWPDTKHPSQRAP